MNTWNKFLYWLGNFNFSYLARRISLFIRWSRSVFSEINVVSLSNYVFLLLYVSSNSIWFSLSYNISCLWCKSILLFCIDNCLFFFFYLCRNYPWNGLSSLPTNYRNPHYVQMSYTNVGGNPPPPFSLLCLKMCCLICQKNKSDESVNLINI